MMSAVQDTVKEPTEEQNLTPANKHDSISEPAADRFETVHDSRAKNSTDQNSEETGQDIYVPSKKPSVRYASLPQITKNKGERSLSDIPSGTSTPESTTPPQARFSSILNPSVPSSNLPSRPSSVTATDDENSEEEGEEDYDWSTDEDILDEDTKQTHPEHLKKKAKSTMKRCAIILLDTYHCLT